MRGAPDYEKLCYKKEAREGYRTFASEYCFSSRQWYVRNSDNVNGRFYAGDVKVVEDVKVV